VHRKAREGARLGRSELGRPDQAGGVQASAQPAADPPLDGRSELPRLRRRLRAKEEEVESLQRRLRDIERSQAWRLVQRVRPLVGAFAPPGSLRRRVILRMLGWAYSLLGVVRRPLSRRGGPARGASRVRRLRVGCYGGHSWSAAGGAASVLKLALALSDFYDVDVLLPPGAPLRNKRWYLENLDIDIGDVEVKGYTRGAEEKYDIWLSAASERIILAKTPKRFNIDFSDEAMKQSLLSAVAEPEKVSIIIGTRDNCAYLRRALETLFDCTPPGFELIIVNNASEDETDIVLQSLAYPPLKVINNRTNRGFATFNNQGLRLATRPYALFLNDDVELTPGWLEPLIEMLDRHPEVGAVGSRLLYPDGRIQHDGKMFLQRDLLPYHVNIGGPAGRDERPVEVDTLTGACLIGRRELVGFSEDYRRGYYEDTDMCLRIKERGYSLVLHRGSVVIHHHGVSMGREQRATERALARNQRLFLERWSTKLPSLVHLASEGELARGKLRSRAILPAGALSQTWPLSQRMRR